MFNSQTASSDEKLRYRLDLQAHQIDAVLDHHQVDGLVTSGTVRSRIVEFDVQAPLSAGLEKMRGLKDSMMAALGVRDLALSKHDGRWRLQVDRDKEPPVPLTSLLAGLTNLPPATAAIGLTDNQQPVLLRFGPEDVRHVLIAGDAGAGKTTLLRTIAVALALTSRQSDVQLLLINGGQEDEDDPDQLELWRPLAYLPHLMTDLVADSDLSAEVLRFLVGEMTYRRKQRVRLPRIVVLIDNVVSLLESGRQLVVDDILRLLQHGNTAGIHLVVATSRPESAALDVLFMSNISARLIGRTSDPVRCRKLLGDVDVHAEYLQGAGEFVALADGRLSYFQAAAIGDYDLHWELNRLLNGPRPRLLAQPFELHRPSDAAELVGTTPQAFKRENGVQWVDPKSVEASTPFAAQGPSSAWAIDDEDEAGGLT